MRKRHARLPSTGSYIAITAVSWTSGLDQDFLPAIASTSGRIHCKLRLLFLHAHRETTRFFETYRCATFFNTLKSNDQARPDQETVANFQQSLRPSSDPCLLCPPLPPPNELLQGVAMSTTAVMPLDTPFHSLEETPIFPSPLRALVSRQNSNTHHLYHQTIIPLLPLALPCQPSGRGNPSRSHYGVYTERAIARKCQENPVAELSQALHMSVPNVCSDCKNLNQARVQHISLP